MAIANFGFNIPTAKLKQNPPISSHAFHREYQITWEKLPEDFVLDSELLNDINQPLLAAVLTESLEIANKLPDNYSKGYHLQKPDANNRFWITQMHLFLEYGKEIEKIVMVIGCDGGMKTAIFYYGVQKK